MMIPAAISDREYYAWFALLLPLEINAASFALPIAVAGWLKPCWATKFLRRRGLVNRFAHYTLITVFGGIRGRGICFVVYFVAQRIGVVWFIDHGLCTFAFSLISYPIDDSLTDGSVSFAHSYPGGPFAKHPLGCIRRSPARLILYCSPDFRLNPI